MPTISVQYKYYEPKKGSVRFRTEERLGGQYNLPDIYVPRTVLAKLGIDSISQDDPKLTINVAYTTN